MRKVWIQYIILSLNVSMNAAEKQLVTLRKQQREKVEEIKKRTNYYSTRTLIERYDEGPGTETPLRRRVIPQGPGGTPSATPQRAPPPQPPRLVTPTPQTPAQISPNLQQQLSRKLSLCYVGLSKTSFSTLLRIMTSLAPTAHAAASQTMV